MEVSKAIPPVHTLMGPGDLDRFAPLADKSLRPEHLERNTGATRTQLLPHDLSPHPMKPELVQSPEAVRHGQLTNYAQKFVSQAFFGTMLKQMRNSPFKSDLFSGGRGGEVFAQMHDQHLADRMARGAGRSLAASIVKHMERPRRMRATDSDEASLPPALRTKSSQTRRGDDSTANLPAPSFE